MNFADAAVMDCDWPERVSCRLTVEQVAEIELPEQRFIYLTIDDIPGYNHGGDKTLDALLVTFAPRYNL